MGGLLAGTAMLALATPAAGQDAGNSPNTTDAQAAPETGAIKDIVVTANKTESSAQKTPIALRVVSGEELRTSGVSDVNSLSRLAPDLNITTDTVYNKLALRGVSAESIAEGADAALTVNVDGEYINRPAALNASFFDLDRIEVLKGPQGTLYGRNSTAGAINIITKKPDDRFDGYVTAGYGNFNAWNVEGAINAPLGGGFAVRVAGIHTQHDGYRDTGPGGRQDDANVDGIRGTLAYDGGGPLTGFVQGEYVYSHSTGPTQYGVPISTSTPGVVALPTVGGGVDYLPINSVFPLPKDGFPTLERGDVRIKNLGIRGQLDYDFGGGVHLTYVGGYLDNKTNAYLSLSGNPNVLQFVSANPHNDSQDFSNELRLSYKGDNGLFLQGGAFYFHEKQVVQQSIQILDPPFGPPGTTLVYVNAFYRPYVKLDSLALFAQGDVPITDTLKLTAGVRYTRDKKRALYVNSGLGFVDPGFGMTFPTEQDIVTAVGSLPAECQSIVSGNYSILNQCYGPKGQWSWLGGLEWNPAPGHMLYAKVSTGFRSGGFDNLTQQVVNGQPVGTFAPEHITSYEVGSKNRFLNDSFELNLSAFHYDYTNLQVDNFINTTVGHATVNAGKARFNGVEVDAIIKPSSRDQFTGTFNWLDAKYIQFTAFATGINDGTPPVDLSGKRPPNAPMYTVAVGYDHIFPLGNAGELKASAYSRFKSAYFLTSYNFLGEKQEAYSQTDVSLTWTAANRGLSVQAYVHNLENYIPLTYASFTGGSSVNLYNYAFGAPRTYGASATFKF